MGGGPTIQAIHTRPLKSFMGAAVPMVGNDVKVRGLKLKIPEEHFGSRVLIVHWWLTEMEWWFWITKYPIHIWVDVCATRIIDAAQLKLINPFRISNWVGAIHGPSRQNLGKRWSNPSFPCQSYTQEALSNGHSDSGYCPRVHSIFPYLDTQGPTDNIGRGVLTIYGRTGAKIWEQIGFHVEGDLGRAMAMVEKADVPRA